MNNCSPIANAIYKYIYNSSKIIEIIGQHKDKINTKNIFGETPLELAYRFMLLDVFKVLLENGADPNNITHEQIIYKITNKN